jgi:hypothetical protein
MNLFQILELKYPEADFYIDIVLADEGKGNGPFIKEWNLKGVPEPTVDDIKRFRNEVEPVFNASKLSVTREAAYNAVGATINKLAVAMWESIAEGRPETLDALQVKRLAVKKSHPKP